MQESRELIETLWNVNSEAFQLSSDDVGINRNIVECKYRRCGKGNGRKIELIETLWNVNTQSSRKLQTASGINRNIVECKYER